MKRVIIWLDLTLFLLLTTFLIQCGASVTEKRAISWTSNIKKQVMPAQEKCKDYEMQFLGTLDNTFNWVFSKDKMHYAYVSYNKLKDKMIVIIDGKGGPEINGIGEHTPIFSYDGKRFAYVARKRGKDIAIVDDNQGPEFDIIWAGSLTFSPDGKRFAYCASKGEKAVVIVDDKQGPEFDFIPEGNPIFSSDSKRFAYSARRGNKWLVVVDGNEGPEFDFIGGDFDCVPIFSPDSKKFAYAAKKGDKEVVIINTKQGPEFDGIMKDSLSYSSSENAFLYVARSGNSIYLVKSSESCN